VAWSLGRNELYFVESSESLIPRISRLALGRTKEIGFQAEVITWQAVPGEIRDLQLSADERTLGYISYTSGQSRVHRHSLLTGEDAVILTWQHRPTENLYLFGWRQDVIVAARSRLQSNRRPRLEIIEIDKTGLTTSLMDVDGALAATAHLDSSNHMLYLVRVENEIYNLYRVSLSTRISTRLTDNELPSVAFGKPAVGQERALVYARTEQRNDIWMARFGHPE
jgi:hypothetical protein